MFYSGKDKLGRKKAALIQRQRQRTITTVNVRTQKRTTTKQTKGHLPEDSRHKSKCKFRARILNDQQGSTLCDKEKIKKNWK